jgi:hypothetical protein
MDLENEQDYDTENDVENEDTGHSSAPDVNAQLSELKAQMQNLMGFITNQQKTQNAPPVREEPKLSKEQLAKIAQDPELMAEYMQAHLTKTTKAIQAENAKAVYDKQAYERFPINADPAFKQDTINAMRELCEVDGYQKESPTLLLRAAELVASRRGTSRMDVNKRRDDALDVSNSNAVRTRRDQKVKIDDNDPRVVFAKAFGIKDAKKLADFKATLGAYTPTVRRKGKSLLS